MRNIIEKELSSGPPETLSDRLSVALSVHITACLKELLLNVNLEGFKDYSHILKLILETQNKMLYKEKDEL